MKARILVVDDEPELLQSIALSIRRLGHEVDIAGDADSCMELLKKHDYDIVITDKNMPSAHHLHEESGVEIVRYITLHLPATAVIMITGYATIESAKTVMRLGAFDYLLKPFDEQELAIKITRALAYLSFVNPHNIIELQGRLRNSILDLITPGAPKKESRLNELLATVNANLDQVFMAQKGREKIILTQREALAEIAGWTEQLKDMHSKSDASSDLDLLDKILQVAEHRV